MAGTPTPLPGESAASYTKRLAALSRNRIAMQAATRRVGAPPIAPPGALADTTAGGIVPSTPMTPGMFSGTPALGGDGTYPAGGAMSSPLNPGGPTDVAGMTTGGATPGGTDQWGRAWEGAAGDRYAPNAQNAGMLFDNPQVLGMDVLADQGRRTDTALGEMTAKNAQYGPDLAFLTLGAGEQGGYTDDAAFNMISDYLSEGMTPGGQGVDTNALLQNILGEGIDGNGQGSPLAVWLQQGTPEEQVQRTQSLIEAALQMGSGNTRLNWARAQMSDQAGDRYLQSRARGTRGTSREFNEYLNAVSGGGL